MATVPSNNLQNLPADTGFRAAFKIKLPLIICNGTVMVQSTYLVGGTLVGGTWWVVPGG